MCYYVSSMTLNYSLTHFPGFLDRQSSHGNTQHRLRLLAFSRTTDIQKSPEVSRHRLTISSCAPVSIFRQFVIHSGWSVDASFNWTRILDTLKPLCLYCHTPTVTPTTSQLSEHTHWSHRAKLIAISTIQCAQARFALFGGDKTPKRLWHCAPCMVWLICDNVIMSRCYCWCFAGLNVCNAEGYNTRYMIMWRKVCFLWSLEWTMTIGRLPL